MARWTSALFATLMACLPASAAPPEPPRRVLFLCTGNYFRSVFAERWFNALAARNQRLPAGDPRRKALPWEARSRGLDIAQLSPGQRAAGISQYTLRRLQELAAGGPDDPSATLDGHVPTALTLADLQAADLVIALHEPSHRPLLEAFLAGQGGPARALKAPVRYWQVPDVVKGSDVPPGDQARRSLEAVQASVEALFAGL